MTIDAERQKICANQIMGQKNEMIMVEGDLIVPDIKPDIVSTIHTSGNVYIYKKEVLDDKVRIDGGIHIYIMYLADSSDGRVRGIHTTLDFTQILDIAGVKSGMNLDDDITIKSIECKILNGRKISINAILNCNVKIYSNEEIEIVNEIHNVEGIQSLKQNICLNSLVGMESSKAYAKETVMIENTDNLAEILSVHTNLINKEAKISYNKILAKADLDVRIMYLTEDNRIGNVSTKIPVMGFIDMVNISDDNICNIKYKIKNLVVKPNNVDEHSIYVEAEIEILCQAFEKRELSVIQDMYSPNSQLQFSQKTIDTLSQKEIMKEDCDIKENISIPEIGQNRILQVETNWNITEKKIMEGKIILEGEANLNFIFESDNVAGIDTKRIDLPFQHTMINNEIISESMIDLTLSVKNDDFIVESPGMIQCHITLEVNIDIFHREHLNVIENIALEDQEIEDLYSMVIYFVKPGDSLWKIAKQFRSTMEDIARVNEIENENKLEVGKQLFIPKYTLRKIS